MRSSLMLWRLQVHSNDYFVYSCSYCCQQFLAKKNNTQKNYHNTLFPNLFSPLLIIQTIIPRTSVGLVDSLRKYDVVVICILKRVGDLSGMTLLAMLNSKLFALHCTTVHLKILSTMLCYFVYTGYG